MLTWSLALVALFLAAFVMKYFSWWSVDTADTSAVENSEEKEVQVEVVAKEEDKKQEVNKDENKDGKKEEDVYDRRLPPLQNSCWGCSKTAEELGKAMLRCSQCKNAFYCHVKCQKKEWKSHKYNCSLLPAEGIKPASIPVTKELVEELNRVDDIMAGWMDKLNEITNGAMDKEGVNAADLPEALPICQLKLSPEFEFDRVPQNQIDRFPFRKPLIQISRLYLIALVAFHPSPADRKLLMDRIDSVNLPSHVAALYGPKVVNRPADLSAGEYDTFAMIAASMMNDPGTVDMWMAQRGRWVGVAYGMKKLWNATLVPRPGFSPSLPSLC